MLKAMRKNVKALSVSLWIVVASFIFFIFYSWGTGGRLVRESINVIAKVGKQEITIEEYKSNLYEFLQRLSRMQSGRLTKAMIKGMGIPERVLNDLISDRIILALAEKLNLVATDEEVREKIINSPEFQRDGRFIGFEEYRRLLAYNRINLKDFEDAKRMEVLKEKFVKVLTSPIVISEKDILDYYKQEKEKINVEYAIVDISSIQLDKEPSINEMRSWFEKNKSEFKIPEKRKGVYVLFDIEKIKGEVDVTESEIRDYWSENQFLFQIPEKRRVSRILLKFGEKDKEQILKQANEIASKLKSGESFEELAKKFSQDEKAKEGGDWGFDYLTSFPEVELKRIQEMNLNEISDPIELKDSFSILKVREIVPASVRPLEEVSAQIREILIYEKAQNLAQRRGTDLANEAKKKNDLLKVAKSRGFEIKWTPYLPMEGETIEDDPSGAINSNLFNLELKKISSPFTTFRGICVLQLVEIQKGRDAKFEEVESRVKDSYIKFLKKEKAKDISSALKSAIPYKSVENSAKDANLKYYNKEIGRMDSIEGIGYNPYIQETIFNLKEGDVSEPLSFENGYVIFRVIKYIPPDMKDYEKEKERIRNTLEEKEKNKFIQAFFQKYREELKVKLNQDAYQKVIEEILGKF
ncbi:MAG: peptidyl-prolyl cis-trans isomerase [Candidatus Aminicenantia bacterium]